MQKVLWCSS